MANFDKLREQVRDAQAGLESQRREIFLAGERVRRLELDKQRVARSQGTDSDAFQSLSSQQDEWRGRIETGRGRLNEAVLETKDLLVAFDPFLDPRDNLDRLSDPGSERARIQPRTRRSRG